MRKVLLFLGIFLSSIMLIACDEKEDPGTGNGDDIDFIPTINLLEEALTEFDGNNYELKIDVNYYNQTKGTLYIKVDGKITHFVINDDNDEYYVREGRNLISYVRDGDKYVVEENRVSQNSELLLFNNLDANWFEVENEKFVVPAENLENIEGLLTLDEDFKVVKATLEISEEGKVTFLEIEFDHLGYVYFYRFYVSNFGEVSIVLPEVNK